ncbi:MAG: NADH-quinone oxidoreductase subunit C [Actinomycetales bacterium]|nr:NADH-quinone oxidoreductase subunit C [Actinomycetales bacterium]
MTAVGAGAPPGPGAAIPEVPASAWEQALRELSEAGFDCLDFLTAVDRGHCRQVIARIRRSADWQAAMVSTQVAAAAPVLASATGVFPGASWHERETAEMFGIEFEGLADSRPLLLRAQPAKPPLLRGEFLPARVARPWPGAAEPEVGADGRRAGNPSRRRQRPLGVPDEPAQGRP